MCKYIYIYVYIYICIHIQYVYIYIYIYICVGCHSPPKRIEPAINDTIIYDNIIYDITRIYCSCIDYNTSPT